MPQNSNILESINIPKEINLDIPFYITTGNLRGFFLPGLYAFIDQKNKLIWISFSECIAESIVRNLKLITDQCHSVPELNTRPFEIVLLETHLEYGKSKTILKRRTAYYSNEYIKKGYRVISKQWNYKARGIIQPHFSEPNKYLYYIKLNSLGGDLVIGVFDKVADGDAFITKYYKNYQDYKVIHKDAKFKQGFWYAKNDLTKEYYRRLNES